MKKNSTNTKYLLYAIIAAFIIRIFLFEIYLVPSESMENAILPGEFILINKFSYGARLNVNRETEKVIRVCGISGIKHNDVLVFNFPDGDSVYSLRPEIDFHNNRDFNGYAKSLSDTSEFGPIEYLPVPDRQAFIKRCVALPGDTFRLLKDKIYINGKALYEPPTVIKRADLPKIEMPEPAVKVDYPKPFYPNYHYIFPHFSKELWWDDYFGPIYVPRKGGTITLTYQNLPYYKRVITAFEHNNLDTLQGNIYINGISGNSYTFKQNYFFMMGDNRVNSRDSRFWGFVPESHIIGKAVLILYSYGDKGNYEQGIRWKRILKSIK